MAGPVAGAARGSGPEDRPPAPDLHRPRAPRLRGDQETLAVVLFAILTGAPPGPAALQSRQVAFTFDDIPGVHHGGCESLNRDLVRAIQRNRIPATGLVNEGHPCSARSRVYEMWLDAGLELGNHTASHRDFNRVSLEEFQEDTIAGEATLRPMLEKRGRRIRYFRFPFLRSGTELAKKRAFEAFLDERGYTNAVVTIDNDEYIYAAAYLKADGALRKRIGADYIRYMERVFAFYEQLSKDTLGYELPQVLLLHDNRLNADMLDALAAMIRRRGYSFVPLERALRDPAYQRRDSYVGRRGLSWLHRWALEGGKTPPMQPEVPEWVSAGAR